MATWTQHTDPATGLVVFRKTYDDGLDVSISLVQTATCIVVRSQAELRTSGPVVTDVGTAVAEEDAEELARNQCRIWDERQNNPPDWRKLKAMS